MRKLFIALYALWVILAIVLKIMGCSWWVGLSWVWFPFATYITFGATIVVMALVIKGKEKKVENSCENCLHASAADLLNKTRGEGTPEYKCIGEREGCTRGTLCEHYIRKN